MARDGGSGIGTVITWAAVAGGAYLLYQWWQSQPTAAAAATTPAAPTPTAAANASTPAPGASSVSTLDALYAAMVQAANAANPWSSLGHTGTLNPDQWGYYLGQVAGTPAPDALQAFPSYNRSTNWPNISAAQYWAGIAPLVAQQKGLSGVGVLAGLGRVAMGRR